MDKINEWLLLNDLPVIERTRQGHFIINQAVFTKLGNRQKHKARLSEQLVFTEEQRIQLILTMILASKEELSLNHFTYELGVSKNTVLNDIKQAQTFLDSYKLTVRYTRRYGYLLEGKEFQIRKVLSHVTTQVLQMPNGEEKLRKIADISQEQVDEVTQRVENVENQ